MDKWQRLEDYMVILVSKTVYFFTCLKQNRLQLLLSKTDYSLLAIKVQNTFKMLHYGVKF